MKAICTSGKFVRVLISESNRYFGREGGFIGVYAWYGVKPALCPTRLRSRAQHECIYPSQSCHRGAECEQKMAVNLVAERHSRSQLPVLIAVTS
jgi:hypothetical protein